jgi:hypothetical protein
MSPEADSGSLPTLAFQGRVVGELCRFSWRWLLMLLKDVLDDGAPRLLKETNWEKKP